MDVGKGGPQSELSFPSTFMVEAAMNPCPCISELRLVEPGGTGHRNPTMAMTAIEISHAKSRARLLLADRHIAN